MNSYFLGFSIGLTLGALLGFACYKVLDRFEQSRKDLFLKRIFKED